LLLTQAAHRKTREHVLYAALRAAGIKPGYRTHGFHLFRHSAGSIVHSITRDVKTTRELLGLSRLSTTADERVRQLDREGKLPAEKMPSGQRVFRVEDVERLAEERTRLSAKAR
jgi:integrase